MQLLRPEQKHLVPVLGKRSGYDEGYSKRNACRELGFDWVPGGIRQHSVVPCDGHGDGDDDGHGDDDTKDASRDGVAGVDHWDVDLLPGCAWYIQLQYLSKLDAGDHEVALCQVTSTGVWNGECVVACDDARAATAVGATTTTTMTRLDPSNVLYTGLLRAEGII